MRHLLVGFFMLCGSVTSTVAQVSIGIGFPGVSIGINLPVYPEFVQVPGYPVYYAPRLSSNFFFYDGMYWVYEGDHWYASSWYNGPWGLVDPWYVPVFVLRVPVRYYRAPPPYFRQWRPDAPPRWGEHWGNDWERHRSGWDQWNRNAVSAPAPLPVYQRRYSGDRYPHHVEQQQELRSQNYRYQPHDPVVRQHYQEHAPKKPSASPQRGQQGNAPPPHANQQSPGGGAAQKPSGAQQQGHPQGKAAQQGGQPKDEKGKDNEGSGQQGQGHKK